MAASGDGFGKLVFQRGATGHRPGRKLWWFPAVFGGMNWAKLKVQSSKLKRMNKLKGTKLTLLTACDRHGRV